MERITIPTLTKLLATRMVASNLLGLSNNLIACFLILNSELANSSNCALEREKNATSAPDINAEQINNPTRTINPKRRPKVGMPASRMVDRNVRRGSGGSSNSEQIR